MAGLLSWYFYDLRRALVSQQEDWWRQAEKNKDPKKMQVCLMVLFGGRWNSGFLDEYRCVKRQDDCKKAG